MIYFDFVETKMFYFIDGSRQLFFKFAPELR